MTDQTEKTKPKTDLTTKLALATLVLLTTVVGLGFGIRFSTPKVWLANGLPFAVDIEVGEDRFTLQPGELAYQGWLLGSPEFARVYAGGEVIEEIPLALEGKLRDNLINPLGAPAIYEESFPYLAPGATEPESPALVWHCGESFAVLDVDCPFGEPPDEIQLDERQKVAWKTTRTWPSLTAPRPRSASCRSSATRGATSRAWSTSGTKASWMRWSA